MEVSRTREGRDDSFKTPSSSQFLPRKRLEMVNVMGKQKSGCDVAELIQAERMSSSREQ